MSDSTYKRSNVSLDVEFTTYSEDSFKAETRLLVILKLRSILILSDLSAISIKEASALATTYSSTQGTSEAKTVGLESRRRSRTPAMRVVVSINFRSWPCSLATPIAAVFRTYGS
jgi:hypothetical protein